MYSLYLPLGLVSLNFLKLLFVDFWSGETYPEQLTFKALNDKYTPTKTIKEFHHLTIHHFSRND